MAWYNSDDVGGRHFDFACFFVKSHHLDALTVDLFVVGRKNWRTSFCTVSWDSLLGRSLILSCDNARITSSLVTYVLENIPARNELQCYLLLLRHGKPAMLPSSKGQGQKLLAVARSRGGSVLFQSQTLYSGRFRDICSQEE